VPSAINANEYAYYERMSNECFCSFRAVSKGPIREYKHLSQLVNKSKNLEFLLQILPEKIRVHKFQEMLRLNRFAGSDSSSSESGSESDG